MAVQSLGLTTDEVRVADAMSAGPLLCSTFLTLTVTTAQESAGSFAQSTVELPLPSIAWPVTLLECTSALMIFSSATSQASIRMFCLWTLLLTFGSLTGKVGTIPSSRKTWWSLRLLQCSVYSRVLLMVLNGGSGFKVTCRKLMSSVRPGTTVSGVESP